MARVIKKIQVNIPFTMLYESYLPRFFEYGLNPEIGLDAEALDRFSHAEFEGVARQIHQKGLAVTLHAPYIDLSPGSPDPAIRALTRKRFQQVSQLVPLFQPRTVVCHSGYDQKRYWGLKDLWVRQSVELWSWLSEEVGRGGSLLVLENVYEHNPEEFLDFYGKLKECDVGFCLDTGHQSVFGQVDLSQWLEGLGAYIEQVHLHDNSGTQDDHVALGQGHIDFPMLFSYLKTKKAAPPVITIEPHREEDLWPSLDYLERIWPW